MIAQHDRAAELLVRRRARAWGLTFPMVTLAGAFLAAPGADTVTLEATAAPGYLQLRGGTGGRVDSAQVLLTPLLGWAMLQTPVGVQHPLAPLVQVGWLACLLVPIGWWSGRSGRRRVVLIAWGASAASLLGVSRLLAVAPVPAGDLLLGLTMLAASAIAGWRSAARHPGFARG